MSHPLTCPELDTHWTAAENLLLAERRNNWTFHPQYYLLGYGERSVLSDWQESLQLVITKLEQFSNSKHRPSFFSAPDSMEIFLILTSQSVKEKKVNGFFIELVQFTFQDDCVTSEWFFSNLWITINIDKAVFKKQISVLHEPFRSQMKHIIFSLLQGLVPFLPFDSLHTFDYVYSFHLSDSFLWWNAKIHTTMWKTNLVKLL